MNDLEIEKAIEIIHSKFRTIDNFTPEAEALKTLLSLATQYLSIKAMPAEKDIYKLKHGAIVNNTWREEGYNQARQEMLLAIIKLMPSEEEIEKSLGEIEIPINNNPMYVEETSNPAIIKLKSKYTSIIATTIYSLIQSRLGGGGNNHNAI